MSIISKLASHFPNISLIAKLARKCRIDAKGKDGVKIYLTFDDGPSGLTPRLLKILKRHNVKATFFIVKPFVKADVLKSIVSNGHVIGLHTYSHKFSQIYSSEDAFMSDLKKLEDYLFSVTGLTTRLYRFPGGSFNKVSERYCPGIMDSLKKKLLAEGRLIFDWNCDNEDGEREHLGSLSCQSRRKQDFGDVG